jgi:acyl-CoA thioester hydrolase
MHNIEVPMKIPFHDVDVMEITWHGHYVKYFEIARCELFDKIDYNYRQMKESGYAWPVIDMHIRYPHPTTFAQDIIVCASITEWENRLKVNYIIKDSNTGKSLIRGHTIQVAVKYPEQEMCLESPQVLFDKMGIQS